MSAPAIPAISDLAYPILFGTGLVAGFVDSIAGGGGLITIPVLLGLGLPPQFALGTNKLQATFGSGSAAWHYRRLGVVKWSDCRAGIVYTSIGALAGALCVHKLDPALLKQLLPALLLAIAAYVILKPNLGEEDLHPRFRTRPFYLIAGLALGFYDGFLGPGTGSFWTMALMLGLGFNLTKATGCTKVMNFASNVSSLAFFLFAGRVIFPAGLVMGVGQLLGARMGAHVVVNRGTRLIRPVFLSLVLVLTAKLLYDNYRKP